MFEAQLTWFDDDLMSLCKQNEQLLPVSVAKEKHIFYIYNNITKKKIRRS